MNNLLQNNQPLQISIQKVFFYHSFLCGVLPALAVLLLLFFKNKFLQLPQTFAIKLSIVFCNLFINFLYFIALSLHFIIISYVLVILTQQFSQSLFNEVFYFFTSIFIIIISSFVVSYYLIINPKKINLFFFIGISIIYSIACLYCMAFKISGKIIGGIDNFSLISSIILFFILISIMQLLVDTLALLNNKRLFYYNFILFMPFSIFTLVALYFKEKLLTNKSTKLRKISIVLINIFIVLTFIVNISILFAFIRLFNAVLYGPDEPDGERSLYYNSSFYANLLYTSLFYISTCIIIYLLTKFNKNTGFIAIFFITIFFIIIFFITIFSLQSFLFSLR